MNKYKILYSNENKEINLSFDSDYEFGNRSDGYSYFETEVIKEVINPEIDFEVSRFSHNPYGTGQSKIWYEFLFNNSVTNTYFNSYVSSNLFSLNECYFNSNSFSKSFFKLDFYDTNSSSAQKNYLTVILPTQQGSLETFPSFISGVNQNINIKKPLFALDFIGDKEGFFIYWLKERDYLDIDTFYMSAKFFDAKSGTFVRMVNQGLITSNFNPDDYFYYRVKLDYETKKYEVIDLHTSNRVGISENNSIKWFEYLG